MVSIWSFEVEYGHDFVIKLNKLSVYGGVLWIHDGRALHLEGETKICIHIFGDGDVEGGHTGYNYLAWFVV